MATRKKKVVDTRKKTTVHLPRELSIHIDQWGKRLGTGKNGFISMASALLLAETSKLETKSKRRKLLRDIELNFQRVIAEARESA